MNQPALKPYPAYKPAGVPWLQQVPEHWEEMKVKYIFRERVQKGYPNEPLLAATQSMGVVTKETYGERTVTAQKDLHLLKLVEKDDFVISLRSFQGGIEVSHARGIISPAYTILRINRPCAPGYVTFLLKSAPFIDGLKLLITGIREGQNIDYVRLARTPLPWPSLDEQHLIVRYLHALDAKVKRYIRTKRKLIAALQEQKQAIIQRAVTRGLDPKVKLKPSGVEWLGEVPEHWEVLTLGRVIQLLTGFPFKSDEFSRNSDDVRLLRGINIAPSGIRWDEVVFWKRNPDDGLGAFELRVGDIVLGMDRPVISSGVRATTISAHDTPALLLQRVARLRPTDRLDTTFLLLLLKGRLFTSYIEPIFTGISVPHLSPKQIRGFTIALPSIDEQHAIIRSIEVETGAIDEAVSIAYREIAVLEEYHTRMIADVVTGAVDVRAAAKAMATEVEVVLEEEPLSMAAEGKAEYGASEE